MVVLGGPLNAVGRKSAFDDLEHFVHRVRPREWSAVPALPVSAGPADYRCPFETEEIVAARQAALDHLRAVPQDHERLVPRVGLIGEIYVLLEPAANLDIELMLGEMGVEVHRSIFLTGWTMDNAVRDNAGIKHGALIKEAAAEYMPEMIGGHGQDSIGHTILYAGKVRRSNSISTIHLYPEIVARSLCRPSPRLRYSRADFLLGRTDRGGRDAHPPGSIRRSIAQATGRSENCLGIRF